MEGKGSLRSGTKLKLEKSASARKITDKWHGQNLRTKEEGKWQ